jgi:L-iditol 2-dehydrogenase
MKAAYVKVPFEVEFREVPLPEIAADDVLVRVEACGICGTDLHFARDLATGDAMPLGHEFVGVIEEVGTNVTDHMPGERVVVENHTACGVCDACKNGTPIYCTNLDVVMGEPCLAEFVRAPKTALHRYEGMTPSAAVLAEPLTVALDVVEEGGVPIGSDVAVFGPGPIGLMAVKLAKMKGARKVLLTGHSHSKARIALGRELGADCIVEVDKEDLTEVAKREFPAGVVRVFVTSPPATIPSAFEIARFGATIVFNGISFENSTISFDANDFHFKRLQLRATHSIPNLRFPTAIDLVKSRAIDPDLFISHTFEFGGLPEALRTAEKDKETAVKVVVTMPSTS